MKGKFINFEGLDCSFKETNSVKLFEYIKENITPKVKLFSFPNYESASSGCIKEYLNGDYGKLNEVNPSVISMIYGIDKWATFIKEDIHKLLNDGYYIILDRYVFSNIVYHYGKFTSLHNSKYTLEECIKWIEEFEHGLLNLPKEDILIYMNMPIRISNLLLTERKNKSGTNNDIHEDNMNYMHSVEKTVNDILSNTYYTSNHNIVTIDCVNDNDDIRGENDIFNDILENIKEYL